jgi:hypothetical protein
MRNGMTVSIFALAPVLIGSSRLTPADTADVAAKPVAGDGWMVALIFFAAIGLAFVRRGIRYRRMAAALAGWPVVQGKVLASSVATRVDQHEQGFTTRFIPQVRYTYVTGGTARESEVIKVGLGDAGYPFEGPARAHAGRYPVGAKVLVRYNPADPAVAVLEASQVGGDHWIFAGVFCLLVTGGIVVAILTGTHDGR